jgi:hypothetical protein
MKKKRKKINSNETQTHEAVDMNIESPLDMNGSASTNFDGHVLAFEIPPFDLDAFNAAVEDGPTVFRNLLLKKYKLTIF